jgi:hypothetical protein
VVHYAANFLALCDVATLFFQFIIMELNFLALCVFFFFCYLRIHVLTTQTLHIGLQQWNAHYPIHGICERGLSPNFSPVANPMYQPQLHKLLCITFCIMFVR